MIVAEPWDYLIVTASNESQATAYKAQLDVRRRLGLLGDVREVMVVADPAGRRVGSGGSTICCLLEVLSRELADGHADPARPDVWADLLRQRRILIIHAGGDSRRLPAYGPCGKVFVPLPGRSDSALGATLFDRQLSTYLRLPSPEDRSGQVVITSGDVLLDFAPEEVTFASCGITGVGCSAAPELASKHGVYCIGPGGQVRKFLQKPSPATQADEGAVDGYGQSVLDIGVIHLDAATAVGLLKMCDVRPDSGGTLAWHGPMGDAIFAHGLDVYREICCAMGTECTPQCYRSAVRLSGSRWEQDLLDRIFATVSAAPCRVEVLRHCGFLHFGTTRQIIASGQELVLRDDGLAAAASCLSINNRLADPGDLAGSNAWVEGCSIRSQVTLAGDNVVVGVDVDEPLPLPQHACLDLLAGRSRSGQPVSFIRCYCVGDSLHTTPAADVTLCGRPLSRWLESAQAEPEDVWDAKLQPEQRIGWNARLFPAEHDAGQYRRWLWMFQPAEASDEQHRAWRSADRYSLEEMAALADQEAFHGRRAKTRGAEIRNSLRRFFRGDSGFSAADLAHVLAHTPDREGFLANLLAEAHWYWDRGAIESARPEFIFSRIMHTLGSALLHWADSPEGPLGESLPGLADVLRPTDAAWLGSMRLEPDARCSLAEWADRSRAVAFEHLRRKIVGSGGPPMAAPVSALRSDEIVWGRAPARLDLTGGWTDTPPFSLEHGGCVLNAAAELNGQPPIQVYARVTPEPLIRVRSIDLGTHLDIRRWDELLDYGSATGEFSLVKAALVISGFSPEATRPFGGGDPSPTDGRPAGETLEKMLAKVGGGLELTALAAIPKGSGLGTSSIMGAVLLAVINRVIGRQLSATELFHAVLRLEQALTTGGGWQDQIGGSVEGLKLITTRPALIPEATIRFVPADVLDPKSNGGQTLLYYTGITRLAKNILEQVVGRYLDRDREAMATLGQLRALAPEMTEAIARKDLPALGRLVDVAWRLNKQLDPNSTNAEIDALLARVRPHIHGAKLLGAGGGGFLLLVCKSPEDAARLRNRLEAEPPNRRARFFDFEISKKGLTVSVC